jgi:hypothetical protein
MFYPFLLTNIFLFNKAPRTIRHNYHAEAESLMNKHINLELYASYVYISMVIMMNYDKFMMLKQSKNSSFYTIMQIQWTQLNGIILG